MKTKLLMVCIATAMLFFMAGYMASVCIYNTRHPNLTQEQMREMAADGAQRAEAAARRAEDAAQRAEDALASTSKSTTIGD